MNDMTEGAKVLCAWTGGANSKKWVADDHSSMVISMQDFGGGKNMLPWIKVTGEGEHPKIVLINCVALEGVTLAPKEG